MARYSLLSPWPREALVFTNDERDQFYDRWNSGLKIRVSVVRFRPWPPPPLF
jgi:hypothetical protein